MMGRETHRPAQLPNDGVWWVSLRFNPPYIVASLNAPGLPPGAFFCATGDFQRWAMVGYFQRWAVVGFSVLYPPNAAILHFTNCLKLTAMLNLALSFLDHSHETA